MAATVEHAGIIETADRLLDQFRRTTGQFSATSRPHAVQERGVVPDLRRIASLLGLATGDTLHHRGEASLWGVTLPLSSIGVGRQPFLSVQRSGSATQPSRGTTEGIQPGRSWGDPPGVQSTLYSDVLPSKCSLSASASSRVWWTTPGRNKVAVQRSRSTTTSEMSWPA